MDQDTKTSLLQSLSKSRACASGREREKKLSVRLAAGLPGLNRTSIYYKHRNNKSAEEELVCKALIDRIHTDTPSWGARQLSKQLRLQGFKAGRFRTMRFMREMGIDAIYPKWFRSFRYEEAYLTQYNNIREAREAIRIYVKKYNFERCHSAIGGVPPALIYYPAMLLEAARAAA